MAVKKFLVAMHHELTAEQIKGSYDQFGDVSIYTLKEVNPKLWAKLANIDPNWSFSKIWHLANEVDLFLRSGEYHYFSFSGEPAMFAAIVATLRNNSHVRFFQPTTERKSIEKHTPEGVVKTSIFSHVQWREIYY